MTTRLDVYDIPSEHPGTEISLNIPSIHMVAEPSTKFAPTTGRNDNDINHPSTPTSPLMVTSHLLQQDPHELADDIWTSPSSSSGRHPPEADDIQLGSHRVAHQDSQEQLQRASSTSGSQTPRPPTSLEAIALASGTTSHWSPTSISRLKTHFLATAPLPKGPAVELPISTKNFERVHVVNSFALFAHSSTVVLFVSSLKKA